MLIIVVLATLIDIWSIYRYIYIFFDIFYNIPIWAFDSSHGWFVCWIDVNLRLSNRNCPWSNLSRRSCWKSKRPNCLSRSLPVSYTIRTIRGLFWFERFGGAWQLYHLFMVDWKVLLFLKFRRSYVLLVCYLHQAKTTYEMKDTGTRNPKQPCVNGCFKWMIPNIYTENGGLAKHPF